MTAANGNFFELPHSPGIFSCKNEHPLFGNFKKKSWNVYRSVRVETLQLLLLCNCTFPLMILAPFCITLLCNGCAIIYLTDPTDGHLGGFQLGAFTENAAVDSVIRPCTFQKTRPGCLAGSNTHLWAWSTSSFNWLFLPWGQQGPGLAGCSCSSAGPCLPRPPRSEQLSLAGLWGAADPLHPLPAALERRAGEGVRVHAVTHPQWDPRPHPAGVRWPGQWGVSESPSWVARRSWEL